MADILRIALVGAGRIGKFHARHICELSRDEKNCQLVAIVDPKPPRTHAFMEASDIEAQVFTSVEELIAADVCDAALVASSTDTHYAVTKPLIDAGLRVMMEKPMTESLESDREFTKYLNETAPHALMLAFQRRFDEPLCYAKEQLEQNRIGRPFKFISILEDSGPPPDGYESPGLLIDMSVHNIDEILWLCGQSPTGVSCVGSRIYNHLVSTVDEDFDNASMQLSFDANLVAQIEVSRVHVPGYHVETCIYGDEGLIRIGAFQADPLSVTVETFGREGALESRVFKMRDYNDDVEQSDAGSSIPEFIHRFGPAYKAELAHFVQQCIAGQPFAVGQNDGLRAGEIAAAGMAAIQKSVSEPIAI